MKIPLSLGMNARDYNCISSEKIFLGRKIRTGLVFPEQAARGVSLLYFHVLAFYASLVIQDPVLFCFRFFRGNGEIDKMRFTIRLNSSLQLAGGHLFFSPLLPKLFLLLFDADHTRVQVLHVRAW